MSKEREFGVGDAVRLRVEGSPVMRVEAIEADGRLLCAWNDGAGTRKNQAFPPRGLRAAEIAPAATTPSNG